MIVEPFITALQMARLDSNVNKALRQATAQKFTSVEACSSYVRRLPDGHLVQVVFAGYSPTHIRKIRVEVKYSGNPVTCIVGPVKEETLPVTKEEEKAGWDPGDEL